MTQPRYSVFYIMKYNCTRTCCDEIKFNTGAPTLKYLNIQPLDCADSHPAAGLSWQSSGPWTVLTVIRPLDWADSHPAPELCWQSSGPKTELTVMHDPNSIIHNERLIYNNGPKLYYNGPQLHHNGPWLYHNDIVITQTLLKHNGPQLGQHIIIYWLFIWLFWCIYDFKHNFVFIIHLYCIFQFYIR